MSGGSAFYVLIYAVFYFVNKVFLLGGSATFWGWDLGKETVGLLSPSVPVPAQSSAHSPSRQEEEGVGAPGLVQSSIP